MKHFSAVHCTLSVVILTLAAAPGCGADPGARAGDEIGSSTAGLHCGAFDPYRAALAHATVACTGTIGPSSFEVDSSGYLQRAFHECSAAEAQGSSIRDIDDLLSIQRRENLPNARACFADHWSEWKASFTTQGNAACPAWTKVGGEGMPTRAAVASLAEAMPKPIPSIGAAQEGRAAPTVGHRLPDTVTSESFGRTEENFFYRVAFEGEPPKQSCGAAEACAAQCAGGLPGFYVGLRDGLVVGDPLWWLDPTYYGDGMSPYMIADYYHPMSFYRELPGAIYGHKNRVGEKCSLWNGAFHMIGILRLYCIPGTDMMVCPSSECTLDPVIDPPL
jgi:hypothetical protein